MQHCYHYLKFIFKINASVTNNTQASIMTVISAQYFDGAGRNYATFAHAYLRANRLCHDVQREAALAVMLATYF
jgi:hypothetical protein